MLNGSRTILLIAGFFLLLLNACKENEIYPATPSVEWKSNYFLVEKSVLFPGVYDTLIGINVAYKDGDGDIGLDPKDTFAPFDRQLDSIGAIKNPYFYNLYVDYLELKNGVYQPFILPNTNDTFRVRARVTSLTPDGVHKAIRGNIQYEFSPPLYPSLRSDSIVLRVYIYDRALHKSNVVESPLILLP